jgi:cation transport regulator ChaB
VRPEEVKEKLVAFVRELYLFLFTSSSEECSDKGSTSQKEKAHLMDVALWAQLKQPDKPSSSNHVTKWSAAAAAAQQAQQQQRRPWTSTRASLLV